MEGIPSTPRLLLERCLSEGRLRIGEILLGGDFTLRHIADEGRVDLVVYESPRDARLIARYDSAGEYRPLKTAPNLIRGWLLQAGSLEGVEQALEFLYPGALGLWLASMKGTLRPTSLRTTLDRQTGMYRITQLIREDQALDLVGSRCCSSACLRTVLWGFDEEKPITSLPEEKRSLAALPTDRIPLICRELCNLVVAAARPIAKGNLPKKD
jgi:sirohydrochlorin cobaltochelatase